MIGGKRLLERESEKVGTPKGLLEVIMPRGVGAKRVRATPRFPDPPGRTPMLKIANSEKVERVYV